MLIAFVFVKSWVAIYYSCMNFQESSQTRTYTVTTLYLYVSVKNFEIRNFCGLTIFSGFEF